jgi:predicted component of type VI protein secretion system
MSWKLQTITGEFAGKEVNVDRDLLVGRHQDADILIQSADVSRRHAALFIKDNVLSVQDLGSSNGTFINDIRVSEGENLIKDGDILQFAGHKFSVLAPASTDHSQVVQQPVEAIATAEVESSEKSVAAQMQDQGMPDLKERDSSVQLTRDGMPQNIGVPKPAPIPEGVDVHAVVNKHEACDVEIPATCTEKEIETQKNANIGLISLVVLIIVAFIAWFIFN